MTREEAIEFLVDISYLMGRIPAEFLNEAEGGEKMREAIKILEKPKWIPCSERLPEENGNYLATYESSDGTATLRYEVVDHYGPDWLHKTKHNKAVAWMPLPKPYEEVE